MEREKEDTIIEELDRIKASIKAIEALLQKPQSSTDSYEKLFERFRVKYPGTKRGYTVEFDYFKVKNRDWKQVVSSLESCLDKQIRQRKQKQGLGQFIPEWKNLKTYLGNRGWEEEYTVNM